MPDSLFTLLFKYRPVVFEDGRFAFEAARPWIVTAGALAVAVAAMAAYSRQRARVGGRDLALLCGLRVLSVALLFFALLRPTVSISTAVPGENFLAVLIDDSRSMRLAGDGSEGASRGRQALGAFTAGSSELLDRLKERFTLRYYRFSDAVSRTDPAAAFDFDGNATRLGAALDYVRQDLNGIPLAGAVVVTDGADNAEVPLSEPLLQLASRGIPVYTVGLGEERFERDIELARVSGPQRLLRGSAFPVDVTVAHQGYGGETVTLTVEQDGAIAATRDVALLRGQAETDVRLNLTADHEGTHVYHFSIGPRPDETVAENNAREILVTAEDRREKILYLEGEPRWELGFLRRALNPDENLRVVVLQRSAENKLLRLGVDDALELASGFPSTREELFAYRGLVIGTVEASFFTDNQLAIIEEFVSQRGGGLLFLGGRRSFAEGGFAGTPLETVFPVVLEEPTDGAFLAELRVAPTAAGLAQAALQLGPSPEASEERWATLPPLSTRNPLYRLKPGATLLLTGTPLTGGDDMAVLASQRYGRGRVAAFTVQDSWIWQMHADVPLEDQSHEKLWRQLLRWLVEAVPGQVTLELANNRFAPGEPVSLRAEVRDAGYLGLNGARVSAKITDPTGAEQTIPLDWTVEEDGEYRGRFIPDQLGPYEFELHAEYAGETVGSDTARGVAADLATEYFGAEMNAELLGRIADETGGRFYTARDVENLAEDARFTSSGKTEIRTYDLWDMPVLLLALLAATSAEWILRRRRGLA